VNCTECRDRLLEAAPAVLRGEGASDVAAHLDRCASCRAIAQLLLDQHARLGDALDALAPASAADAAALAAARESRSRRQRRRWVTLAPVAAAAGLAALLVAGGDDVPPQPDSTAPPSPPIVEATDQNVVVYQTDNPDIVVIWLYPNDGSGT
jgi:anti-sigma factor RsiW